MCGLHAGGLPTDNLRDIFRQITGDRLLISILGTVFAMLQPIQHSPIVTTQADFRVDPGAV